MSGPQGSVRPIAKSVRFKSIVDRVINHDDSVQSESSVRAAKIRIPAPLIVRDLSMLVTLNLSNSRLTSSAVAAALGLDGAVGPPSMPVLRHLNLSGNLLDYSFIVAASRSLAYHAPRLHGMDVSCNRIDGTCLHSLRHSRLRELNLSGNLLGKHVRLHGLLLPQLELLNLSGNAIANMSIKDSNVKEVKIVDLSSNVICHISDIVESLGSSTPGLEVLDLSNNPFRTMSKFADWDFYCAYILDALHSLLLLDGTGIFGGLETPSLEQSCHETSDDDFRIIPVNAMTARRFSYR